jgi:hypothetical protein
VKASEYDRYDINRYHFRTAKLEVSCPLGAIKNSGVVANGQMLAADYYGVLQKIIEYMFSGTKELKVVFFNVIDLIQSTEPESIILV